MQQINRNFQLSLKLFFRHFIQPREKRTSIKMLLTGSDSTWAKGENICSLGRLQAEWAPGRTQKRLCCSVCESLCPDIFLFLHLPRNQQGRSLRQPLFSDPDLVIWRNHWEQSLLESLRNKEIFPEVQDNSLKFPRQGCGLIASKGHVSWFEDAPWPQHVGALGSKVYFKAPEGRVSWPKSSQD